MAYDPRLGIEVSISDPIREVIVTANRNPLAFQAARDLVAGAPQLPNWSFRALKPPQGFDFKTEHDGVELSAGALFFESLKSAKHPKDLCIRVFVPAEFADREETPYIVHVILDTGVGEELASRISYFEIAPLPNDGVKRLAIGKLGAFIEWHARKYGQ